VPQALSLNVSDAADTCSAILIGSVFVIHETGVYHSHWPTTSMPSAQQDFSIRTSAHRHTG